jgi:hypothetical protein
MRILTTTTRQLSAQAWTSRDSFHILKLAGDSRIVVLPQVREAAPTRRNDGLLEDGGLEVSRLKGWRIGLGGMVPGASTPVAGE